jgi:ribonuclease P protein component
MATQENPPQEGTRLSEKNAYPGWAGCIKDETVKGTQEINCSLIPGYPHGASMQKKEHLTKPEQFTLVYNEGSTQTDRFLVLKARQNRLELTRYGISVSKRIGNAVVRNRVKRVLREILRLNDLNPGWDIVIIVRTPASAGDYALLNKSAVNLLSRAGIAAKPK